MAEPLGQFRNDGVRVRHGQQDACSARDALLGTSVSHQTLKVRDFWWLEVDEPRGRLLIEKRYASPATMSTYFVDTPLAPPGFERAVLSAGFECASPLVGSGAMQEDWMCAAKQIMQKHQEHKPKQLIERLFYPMVKGFKPSRGPKITFHVRIEDPVTKVLSESVERT